MAATEEFARRVQALPQELYDCVLHFTLTTPETITIESTYRPPPQLQINRATRQTASRSLYDHGTTFKISNIRLCNQWLRSLSAVARQGIQHIDYIRVAGNNSDQIAYGMATSGYADLFSDMRKWLNFLSRQAAWNARRRMIFVRATRHGQGWDLDGGILDGEGEGGGARAGAWKHSRGMVW